MAIYILPAGKGARDSAVIWTVCFALPGSEQKEPQCVRPSMFDVSGGTNEVRSIQAVWSRVPAAGKIGFKRERQTLAASHGGRLAATCRAE
jgi:hypothetical protein